MPGISLLYSSLIFLALGNSGSHEYLYRVAYGCGLAEVRFYALPDMAPADCAEAIEFGYGLASDLNDDCQVNLLDLAEIGLDWLWCVDPKNENCQHLWQ